MKRFWFNIIWYVLAVLVVDIPPFLVFFLMHRFNVMGNLAPQIISTLLFLGLMGGQAIMHLHLLNRRDSTQADLNVWTMLAVSIAVFITFWVIIISMIIWATTAA